MRKTGCLLLVVVISIFTVQAQDTTSMYRTSYADTAKIGALQVDPYDFIATMQERNMSLMRPLHLTPNDFFKTYNSLLVDNVPMFGRKDYNSFENKLQAVDRVGQSIMFNMRSYQRSSEVYGTIGLILGVAAWGAVGYQMLNPTPNPNFQGPPPPKASPPPAQGGPRPMR